MANIKISLDSTKKINNVNIFSDIDIDSNYSSKTLYDRLSVRNSLKNILTWKPYERILNPSFGNMLWETVFDNMNNVSQTVITNLVKKMLAAEPRISVSNVRVNKNAAGNEVFISFSYTIPELDDSEEQYEITISRQ
jgi:phage baseplate assembly protein W